MFLGLVVIFAILPSLTLSKPSKCNFYLTHTFVLSVNRFTFIYFTLSSIELRENYFVLSETSHQPFPHISSISLLSILTSLCSQHGNRSLGLSVESFTFPPRTFNTQLFYSHTISAQFNKAFFKTVPRYSHVPILYVL